jgi:hypothetical protein
MSAKRIGEQLSKIIPLSGHDIEEILSHQGFTGRRFGDIAIQLGLAQPQDVVRAWSAQLQEKPQRVNLDTFNVDVQALNHLPRATAIKYHVLPVRVLDDGLVLAVDEAAYADVSRRLASEMRCNLQFVLTSHHEISRALRNYYPTNAA